MEIPPRGSLHLDGAHTTTCKPLQHQKRRTRHETLKNLIDLFPPPQLCQVTMTMGSAKITRRLRQAYQQARDNESQTCQRGELLRNRR